MFLPTDAINTEPDRVQGSSVVHDTRGGNKAHFYVLRLADSSGLFYALGNLLWVPGYLMDGWASNRVEYVLDASGCGVAGWLVLFDCLRMSRVTFDVYVRGH